MKSVCIVIAFALASGAPVSAEEKAWMAVGRGSDSCGTFVRAIDAMAPSPNDKAQSLNWQNKSWVEDGFAYQQYVFGFVTGMNFSRGDKSKQVKVDGNGIAMWMRHYCESHADESINTAIWTFVLEQQAKTK